MCVAMPLDLQCMHDYSVFVNKDSLAIRQAGAHVFTCLDFIK